MHQKASIPKQVIEGEPGTPHPGPLPSEERGRWSILKLSYAAVIFVAVLSLLGGEVQAKELTSAEVDFFEKKIRPIFIEQCYKCHSATEKIKGGLSLESREDWLKGGDTGAAIEPGDPEKSRLIEAVRYKNRDLQMPPKNPLSEAQIRDLETWVKMGAPDPRIKTAKATAAKMGMSLEEGRKFWSFQPMAKPEVPAVRKSAWVQSPVDAFILAKLEEKKLKPAAPADKRALIRRATFDLIGLPPTPQEIDAFLADRSPGAFAKVVERLLASPQYGERWGRHWLDVARYADSNGLDENVAFGNAWRYRDYVINAFNKDKSYDQFLTEQIAGDLLPRSEDIAVRHERLTALGFLTMGPKLLAEADKTKLEMDMIDEQIDTLGRAFLATTFGCARCHDHKFDPVTTEDYYALAGIFKSTHTMDDWKTIAKWHEPVVALPEDYQTKKDYEAKITAHKVSITNYIAEANKVLLVTLKTNTLPKTPEKMYPTNTVAELAKLRADLKKMEEDTPELPSTMGVMESTNILKTLPVHIRGSHLSLGKPVARGVPLVMTISTKPQFSEKQSGRMELARWLTNEDHPLTARVMVNRIWRWHFGQGLVASTDNFGVLGDKPTHPELLDWLARKFIAEGWSVKAMHRTIMLSSAYQMEANVSGAPNHADPENRLLAHFPLRRLEAEEIRDALLSVAGSLDLTMGGKTLPLKNREFVFNHTSKDATTYESPRRAVYMPIIRNHLYDLFEQFDYPDPAVPNGNRSSTVVAPQALLMMNSELVVKSAEKFAEQLLADEKMPDAKRLDAAYVKAYGRLPAAAERKRAEKFLATFASAAEGDKAVARKGAWTTLCQTLLAANEFIYLN
ncbi:MAG TPA: PSD1 and planctomycete cytochrome C domain-containing protein [Verrucomicrobiae bacterium]